MTKKPLLTILLGVLAGAFLCAGPACRAPNPSEPAPAAQAPQAPASSAPEEAAAVAASPPEAKAAPVPRPAGEPEKPKEVAGEPSPGAQPPAEVGSKAPPAPPEVALSPECKALYDQIRSAYQAIPEELRSLTSDEADRLARDVENMVASARKFDAECRDSPVDGEVLYILAKGLFLLSERFRVQRISDARARGEEDLSSFIVEQMRSYHGEVQGILHLALEKLPPGHPWKRRALTDLGTAASEGGDHEAAFEAYHRFLESYPDDPEIDRTLIALARECLELGRLDLGIEYAERVQRDYFEKETYAYAGELLWRLHHARGDLDRLWEQVQTVETVYPLKLDSEKISAQYRDRLRLYMSYNGFRKGYVLLARGDCGGSAEAFRKNIASIESSANASSAERVILMRSRKNLDFAEKLCGKPPPANLDLVWVTPNRVDLASSLGKVVIVVFRGVGDERSREILKPLWNFADANPSVEMVVVSYLFSGHDVDARAEEMRKEFARAGYAGPAGFDPDVEGRSLFRTFLANVGSATLEIISPEGVLCWLQEDPRSVDAGFITAFAERLLAKRK